MNLDDFWNQSSNDFCWNFFEISGFLKDNRQSVSIITSNLYIELCTKTLAINQITPIIHGKCTENLRSEILMLP